MKHRSHENPKVEEIKNEYLTINELAKALKLHPGSVRNRIQSGMYKLGVEYIKDGRNIRFVWSAIQRKLHGIETQKENPRMKPHGTGCRIII